MADPTPPSDIPDPASPTPASPAPAAGPKRIRSMPDRPASIRNSSASSVRSVPTQERAGTNAYVTGLATEKSWGRGVAILLAIFFASLILELVNATGFVLSGKPGWPVPIEAGRLALLCTFFISLWAGLAWLRYLLATVSFLSGAWLLTDWVLSYRATPKFKATGEADWTIYSQLESMPKVALGLLYLGLAGYVLFSEDIREFIAHRRVRGRIFSALLVTVAVYGIMLLVFAAQPFYGHWMQNQRADAQRFGDDTLHVISANWDPETIFSRLDAAYAKSFTKADRETTFNSFKALGSVKNITPAPVVARPPMPQFPLQDKVPIPQGVDSHPDVYGNGFEVTAKYAPDLVEFEHGKAKFGFDLVRSVSGPWRITKLNVDNVQYDRPPKPAATPAPDATPAAPDAAAPSPAPVPTAAPAATASTLPSDATAPSPAPTPAAPAAPTASPAP